MRASQLTCDDRGVSIAVTHVLTIAIATMLIVGLLMGVGGLLETQKDRGATNSLDTIGERLSTEIASVDRRATALDGAVELRTRHQSTVSGVHYTVELVESTGSSCDGPLVSDVTALDGCLILEGSGAGEERLVPVSVNAAVQNSTAPGGQITIVAADGEIWIEGGS